MNKITSNDLLDKGVVGLDDVPGLSTTDMQKKFDEIAKDVIVPHFNELIDDLAANSGANAIGATDYAGSAVTVGNHVASTSNPHNTTAAQVGSYTKAETNNAINTAISQAIIEVGAGDMAKSVYDPNGHATDIFAYSAPVSHANSATTYGKGDATNYGHLKLADTAGTSDATAGVAATPKAVQSAVTTAEAYADNLVATVNNKALPVGGATGQFLAKNSTNNYDTGWVTVPKSVTVTLSPALWSGTIPYTQTVDVTGMTSSWIPGNPICVAALDKTTDLAMQEAASYISVIRSTSGQLTFICYEDKPTVQINLRVPGVY